jgi:hypothetical protein
MRRIGDEIAVAAVGIAHVQKEIEVTEGGGVDGRAGWTDSPSRTSLAAMEASVGQDDGEARVIAGGPKPPAPSPPRQHPQKSNSLSLTYPQVRHRLRQAKVMLVQFTLREIGQGEIARMLA